MRRVLLAAAAVVAVLGALVPATSGAWTASVRNVDAATTSSWFSCFNAASGLAASSVFEWGLTEPSTTAQDASNHGLDGTWRNPHGMAASAGPGGCSASVDQVAVFDGSTGWVGSGQSTLPSGFAGTFSETAWVRTAAGYGGAGDIVLLCNADPSSATCSSRDFRSYLDGSGRFVFAVAADSSGNVWTVTTSQKVNDGRWHAVVGTLSSAAGVGIHVYIDGVDVTATASGALVDQFGTSQSRAPSTMTGGRNVSSGYWRVGAGDGGVNWLGHNPVAGSVATVYFTGNLLGVGVYRRTLTSDQIASLYAAGR